MMPEQMGTSGLVAWCCEAVAHAGKRWKRFRQAAAIVRRRGGSVERFQRACAAGCRHDMAREFLKYKVS